MKKLLLILAIAFLANTLSAQMSFRQTILPGFTTDDNNKKDRKQERKDRKRKDEFKIYVGANFDQLNIANDRFYSNMGVGWDFGFSYKRGRFFYWEIGGRFNNPIYNIKDLTVPPDSSSVFDGIFGVRNIDIPITGGINFLSITSRIIGLRVFVSAVPSFALGVGDNDFGVTKDDLNSFVFYGQGGVGLDIAFFFIEAGFNYGLSNLIKTEFQSNPYQVYANLGFRF
jgi:hypothetical protein